MATRCARTLVLALLAFGCLGASVAVAKTTFVKRVRVSALPKDVQRQLHRAGVASRFVKLVAAPQSVGIYEAASATEGTCVMADHGRGIGGADCDPSGLKIGRPGIITVLFKSPLAPDGTPDKSQAKLVSVYGVALPAVTTLRISGPNGAVEIRVAKGQGGHVAFGTDAPPATGTLIELLNGAGKVVQSQKVIG